MACHFVEYYDITPHHQLQFFVAVPSWWSRYKIFRLLFVLTTPVFVYYSRSNLKGTWWDVLFRVKRSERYIVTLSTLFLLELICVQFGLQKTFYKVFDISWEGVLFQIRFSVREFVDAVGFFIIIHQCSLFASFACSAYRRSGKVDWNVVRYWGWFPYKGQVVFN